ncbi:MAG: hypothetical protein WCP28_07205 [Actinomycetes bacterium]
MSEPSVPQLLADRLAEQRLITVGDRHHGFALAVVIDHGITNRQLLDERSQFWRDALSQIDQRIWL